MEVKIIAQNYNPLLKRKEVVFQVKHEQMGGTPSRLRIRTKLAEMLKTKLEQVYVRKMETKTGKMVALGEATAYDTAEQAVLVEPKHVIERNTPKEKAEEPEKPKEPQKPEKPEKTAEKAKETEKVQKAEKAEKAKEDTGQPKEREK